MSALLDSMAQAFCGSDARREVLDAALRNGLPGARNEAWKYTSLRQLERRSFAAAHDEDCGNNLNCSALSAMVASEPEVMRAR